MTGLQLVEATESGIMPDTINKRLLIVDDEQFVLTALRRLFEMHDYEVVLSTSPEEALVLLGEMDFAVIISDQKMPGMTGTSFLEYARKVSPDTVRVILTGYAEVGSAIEAINRADVFRYITKPWDDDELVGITDKAVKLYHQRKQEQDRLHELAERLQKTEEKLKQLSGTIPSNGGGKGGAAVRFNFSALTPDNPISVLSRREAQIIEYVARGYSNRKISDELSIAETTVKNHLANIFKKLNVANRTEAVYLAQRHGVLTID